MARRPKEVWQCIARVALPTNPSREAVHCNSSTAHCPRQRDSALHEFQAVRCCLAGMALPIVPRQGGSQELRFLGSDRLLGRTPPPPPSW